MRALLGTLIGSCKIQVQYVEAEFRLQLHTGQGGAPRVSVQQTTHAFPSMPLLPTLGYKQQTYSCGFAQDTGLLERWRQGSFVTLVNMLCARDLLRNFPGKDGSSIAYVHVVWLLDRIQGWKSRGYGMLFGCSKEDAIFVPLKFRVGGFGVGIRILE